MKREYLDWSILRLPAIIFSVVLLLSAAIVSGSLYYKNQMRLEYDRNQKNFRSISTQYLQVDEEEELIRQYYPRFVALYEQGLLGTERRLDWIETLQAVSERLEIPSLRYEISSQQPMENELPIDTGKFRIHESVMQINMDMLHEADLFRFLQRIDRPAHGLFSVSYCGLKRLNKEIDVSVEKANVSAECSLKWFNIKPSDGSELVL